MTQADSVHSTPPTNTSALLAQVAHELFELEDQFARAAALAYSVRMLATSDEIDREPGAALNALGATLVDLLDELKDERTRIWQLAAGVKGGEDAEG